MHAGTGIRTRGGEVSAVRGPAALLAALGVAAVLALLPAAPLAAQVPTPQSVLGFRVGADSSLASWRQIDDYLGRLAAASPRVRLDTLGPTTQGRPYLLVTISDPANLARRAELMAAQRRLADPRTLDAESEARLVAAQPAVVLISCSIHSTEIAASQMALELAWRLATDSALGTLLRDVVVLLVPSANPDGIDIVGDWYRRTKGTPYDGSSPPWLWHPYVGHDDNRDWFMLTQAETRLLTRVLYTQWFPEVVYDVHQMGGNGSRLFLPPFDDPVDPNLDGMLVEAINHVGTAMATAVTDAGYTGVEHQARFDLWWHGGNRSVPTRHNMIGILSEAASARIASPALLRPAEVRQPARGVNFPLPWTPGWWRLRDIVDYELAASLGLVRLASHEHAEFVQRFVRAGRRAVEAGRTEQPRAYLIRPGQRDEGVRVQLATLLLRGGIEVSRARAAFSSDGRAYPAGTLVIPLDQPFRAHVKDLFDLQVYPERRQYPGGPLIPPYDVTGWTLPLTMAVAVDSARTAVTADLERLDSLAVTPGRIAGAGDVVLLANRSNGEATAVWRALAAGASAEFAPAPFEAAGRGWPAGTVVVRGGRAALERSAAELGFDATAVPRLPAAPGAVAVRRVPRVGLYRSWNASMDEGWTRWVLERLGVPYTSLTDSVARAGGLRSRFDVLILPSEGAAQIRSGRPAGNVPPEYTGGLGTGGVEALRAFLQAGGTVIALDQASVFAIEDLGAPATVALGGRAGRGAGDAGRFSAPGSIFAVRVDRAHPLASGMDSVAAIFLESSPVLDAASGGHAVVSFPPEGNPLLSGFVLGGELLAGKAALVEGPVGRGTAILFGFSPQHRAQTTSTFKLLTNAILYGAARAAQAEGAGAAPAPHR
jgi:hypothetical protein